MIHAFSYNSDGFEIHINANKPTVIFRYRQGLWGMGERIELQHQPLHMHKKIQSELKKAYGNYNNTELHPRK